MYISKNQLLVILGELQRKIQAIVNRKVNLVFLGRTLLSQPGALETI